MTAPAKAAPMREDVTQADADAAADLIEQYFPNNLAMLSLAGSHRRGQLYGVWPAAFARYRLAHTARPDAASMDAKADNMEARPDAGDEDVERVARAVERDLDVIEMVQASPMVIKQLQAKRIARTALAAMREGVDRGMVDAATALFPEGTMYRSGHDGTGPDPSRFFCEAIGPAPECKRVRVVADTEAEARSQAAAALSPEQPR